MQIYYSEVSLGQGYHALASEIRHDRLVNGQRVNRPSGWAMFQRLCGQPIKCWNCGRQADRWIAEKGPRDRVGHPDLNMYSGLLLMTRDHIIPKSLGGVDDVGNLRPGCTDCNGDRGNEIDDETLRFTKAHPELVDRARIERGLANLGRSLAPLNKVLKTTQDEIARLEKPFKTMGYL